MASDGHTPEVVAGIIGDHLVYLTVSEAMWLCLVLKRWVRCF